MARKKNLKENIQNEIQDSLTSTITSSQEIPQFVFQSWQGPLYIYFSGTSDETRQSQLSEYRISC